LARTAAVGGTDLEPRPYILGQALRRTRCPSTGIGFFVLDRLLGPLGLTSLALRGSLGSGHFLLFGAAFSFNR
jgi:hypothetical protein